MAYERAMAHAFGMDGQTWACHDPAATGIELAFRAGPLPRPLPARSSRRENSCSRPESQSVRTISKRILLDGMAALILWTADRFLGTVEKSFSVSY
jgi:hypothetical protein